MNRYSLIFLIHLALSVSGYYVASQLASITLDRAMATVLLFFGCFVLLWLLSFFLDRPYFKKLTNIFILSGFFVKEFFKANLKLTYEILSINLHMEPAVVSVPLDIQSDLGIMLLANMVNLTPGTLILDVSQDRKMLHIHTLFLEGGSVEGFRRTIKDGFECRLIAVLQ